MNASDQPIADVTLENSTGGLWPNSEVRLVSKRDEIGQDLADRVWFTTTDSINQNSRAVPEPAELVSMLEALAEFEAVAARLCTLRMDQGQREHVQQLCTATCEAARQADRLGYEASNHAFHEAPYQGCRNDIVVEEVPAQTEARRFPSKGARPARTSAVGCSGTRKNYRCDFNERR